MNGKSAGYDDVSPDVFKSVISHVSRPLCHICNLSLSKGIFPDKLKIAKVTPIFKAGDQCEIGNYRPISVLSCLSKLLEKIVYIRTVSFVSKFDILYNGQYGFRSNHSTDMAIMDMVHKITTCLENRNISIGVFLDLSKAFDTINHNILLHKLNSYGIRGTPLDWFCSYLSNRKQYTNIDSCSSSLGTITCGVPQGSLLGPLLFSLYINDICNASSVLSFILFADDTNIFYSSNNTNIQTIVNVLNVELNKVSMWLQANRLSLNLKKCTFMVFSNSKKKLNMSSCQVKINNEPIMQVSHTKFLGVYIDECLTWKFHIKELENKISKNIGIISRLKHILPSRLLHTLYCSLVLPYLSYCNIIWANTYKSNLDKLMKLQKRAIRIICKANFNEHTAPLFRKYKVLSVMNINVLQQDVFMYKFVKEQLPETLRNLFQFNRSIHDYNTRSSSKLHIPQVKTTLSQHTISFSGPKNWNSLPSSITNCPSSNSFRYKLKTFLLNSQDI